MGEPLRFGLIGCGQHGRLLASALTRVPEARLAAGCDVDAAQVGALAGDGIERYTDYRAMLERARLDAVIVATTHPALAAATTAVVESGRAGASTS